MWWGWLSLVLGGLVGWGGVRVYDRMAMKRAEFQRRWENEKYLEEHHDGNSSKGT